MVIENNLPKNLWTFAVMTAALIRNRCFNNLKIDLSNNSDPVDSRKYREIIGSLIYLMTCTRPDLSYAVGKLSQYLSEPRQQHWVAAKHILKYLSGTSHYELRYQTSEELGILAYSDTDGVSDQRDPRSTTGFLFLFKQRKLTYLMEVKEATYGCTVQPTVAL